MKDVYLHIRLSEQQKKELEKIAESYDLTPSSFISLIINRFKSGNLRIVITDKEREQLLK